MPMLSAQCIMAFSSQSYWPNIMYINFDLFQIVFTMFLIVYTYLNTSKTQEFQVKYTGTDVSSASLSGCQNHQSCMFNETMPLTENR